MNYRGHSIDPVSFWERYVRFPPGARFDDEFAPKVQCPNPAHDTLKSHFQINLLTPRVHCFAECGISGSYEHAVCVIEGLYEKFKVDEATDRRERIRRKQRAEREAKKIILRNAKTAQNFQRSRHAQKGSSSSGSAKVVRPVDLSYESYLPPVALEYLASRKISDASVAAWNLGWDGNEKRLVIPAKDENGHLRFLIRRAVLPRQNPKYLYTEGFPKTSLLFGACNLSLGLVDSEGLIVVEGSLDVIRFHQHGFTNTVGILGTGISDEQVKIIARLKPKKVVLAFDRDSAGVRNIEIAWSKLRKYPLYVMRYPSAKFDPAELSAREAKREIGRVIPAVKVISRLNVSGKERSKVGSQDAR